MADIESLGYTLNGAEGCIERGVAAMDYADEAYRTAETTIGSLLSGLEAVSAGTLVEDVDRAKGPAGFGEDEGFVRAFGMLVVTLQKSGNPHAQAAAALTHELATQGNKAGFEALAICSDTYRALRGLAAVIADFRALQERIAHNRQAIRDIAGSEAGPGIAQATITEIEAYRQDLHG